MNNHFFNYGTGVISSRINGIVSKDKQASILEYSNKPPYY